MDILILRDPRESKRKCSLTPLEGVQARLAAAEIARRTNAPPAAGLGDV